MKFNFDGFENHNFLISYIHLWCEKELWFLAVACSGSLTTVLCSRILYNNVKSYNEWLNNNQKSKTCGKRERQWKEINITIQEKEKYE